jgi:hypothetical protein
MKNLLLHPDAIARRFGNRLSYLLERSEGTDRIDEPDGPDEPDGIERLS